MCAESHGSYCLSYFVFSLFFFFFKQKTAYEMRISDWSSDVCSSDLNAGREHGVADVLAGVVGDRPAALGRDADHPARPAIFGEQIVDIKIGRASCRERVCQYV